MSFCTKKNLKQAAIDYECYLIQRMIEIKIYHMMSKIKRSLHKQSFFGKVYFDLQKICLCKCGIL